MASNPIYQFYAELDDYRPKIWRRFQVSRNITVARFGYIIMTLFEMQANHLFCVDVKERENFIRHFMENFAENEAELMCIDDIIEDIKEISRYEVQNELTSDFDDEESENAIEIKINEVVCKSGDELSLTYDYGDNWKVSIVLEKVFKDKELSGRELPRVLEGEGYGILEDCGGTDSLKRIAELQKKKSRIEYRSFSDWYNIEELELDLSSFDKEDMNFRLKKLPRIFAEAYEYGLEPTVRSMKLLMREYKRKNGTL